MIRLCKSGLRLGVLVLSLVWAGGPGLAKAGETNPEPRPNTPIEHFIVEMQENHTFDNYFGAYPGADGIPPGTCMPVDPSNADNAACVEPFHIGDYPVEDLDHSTSTFALQYNEGRLDGFVYALHQRNQDGALAMGYYDDRELPYYWNVADEFVLFDRFFSSAAGGSLENHMYWVAGAPGSDTGRVPLEGFTVPTIFDRLEARGISWKFYVQNYDPTITYRRRDGLGNRASQVIWVPLLNFDRFLDDPNLSQHIVDLNEYFEDLENGTLPAVAFMVPSGASEHPPGSIQSGQKFVKSLIQALMRSEAWSSSAFMLVYDDWGGWYDHVPPPQVDEHGYGFRVPALLISAYARRGYVDSTELDFTSFLKFIEENWDLEPLAERDARANNFLTAFDFSQPPRQPILIPFARQAAQQLAEPRRVVIYAAYGGALVFAGLVLALTRLGVGRLGWRSTHPQSPQEGAEP